MLNTTGIFTLFFIRLFLFNHKTGQKLPAVTHFQDQDISEESSRGKELEDEEEWAYEDRRSFYR